MKLENIFNKKWKSVFIGVSALLAIGIWLMISTGGMEGNRLLSQFSGTNVTPVNAASLWSASPNNPYLNSVGTYNSRLDTVIRSTLSKGANLPSANFQTYLDKLASGIVIMGTKPEYANNQEIKNIIGYISFELADAKTAFSASNVFLSDYTNMVDGAFGTSSTGSVISGGVGGSGSTSTSVTTSSGSAPTNTILIRVKDINGSVVTSGASVYCGDPSQNNYTTYSVGAYNGESGVVALTQTQQENCISKGAQIWLKCVGNPNATTPSTFLAGNMILRCLGSTVSTSTGSTTTTSTVSTWATAPVETINLPIMGLAYGGAGSPWGYEGYEPIKVGKTITIGYETVGMRQCKGWYAKSGETLGQEVQFNWTDSNGNSGGGNTTNLARGEFRLKIDYPTRLEFTCWGTASGKSTKQVIEFRTKAHDATDTFIDVSKETVSTVWETVNVSWQANPGFQYCHLSKTHSVNGVKGNPTVFLDKTIKISERASGTVTDTIATPGRYVYILFCNNNPESTVDLFDSGNMITSRAVNLAGAVTAVVNDKNASGVPYADIRTFVTAVVNDATLSEPARAQKLFNQMGVANVSAADIVFAFKNTSTAFTLSDVNTYLEKRNIPVTVAPVQTTTTPVVTSVTPTPVVVASDKNANGVPYASIRSAILGVLGDTSITEAVQAQRIYDAMQANGVSVADVVFAFKDTSTPFTTETVQAFLAKRGG